MSSSNGKLMTAAKAGNMAEVQKLLNTAGINVNHTEWNGDSPILAASNYGFAEIVQLLAQKGANVNSADKRGESALMQACGRGQVEVSKILVGNGAAVNHQSKTGYTPLMMAVSSGNASLVEYIISQGGDPTLQSNDGKRAADLAKGQAIRDLLAQCTTGTASSEQNSLPEAADAPSPPPPAAAPSQGESCSTGEEVCEPLVPSQPAAPPAPDSAATPAAPAAPLFTAETTASAATAASAPPVVDNVPVSEPGTASAPVSASLSPAGLLPATRPPPPAARRTSLAPPAPAPAPAPEVTPAVAPASASTVTANAEPLLSSVSEAVAAAPSPALVPQAELLKRPAPPALSPARRTVAPRPSVSAPAPQIEQPPSETTPATSVGQPGPGLGASGTGKVGDGSDGTEDASRGPKHEAVAALFTQVGELCHPAQHSGTRLPFHLLHSRTRDLCSHFEHLIAASHAHGQECVVEYFALQVQPVLADVLGHVHPQARRAFLGVGAPSERRLLGIFHEFDADVTRILKELNQALCALEVAELSAKIETLPRLGPAAVYELAVVEEKRRRSGVEALFGGSAERAALELEIEDPHTPLLHPQLRSPMMDGLHSLLSGGGGKDGRMSIFNLNRPLLGVHSRRTPSRRKFEGEQDAYSHLLPTYAELTARLSASVPDSLRQMFTGHKPVPDSPPSQASAPADSQRRAEDPQTTLPTQVADPSASASTPGKPSMPASTSSSPAPVSGKTTPKRFSGSVFSKLGNFDPTKVKPPGARPSVTAAMVSGATGPAGEASVGTSTSAADGSGTQPLLGVIKKEDSVHSPMSHEEDGSPLASANLERATTARTRRAPAKKKFEKPVGELPPALEVVPITPEAPTPTAAEATPKSSSSTMGALRSLFTTRRPTVVATSSAGSGSPGQPALPAVLADSDGADSTSQSPKTPGSAGASAAGVGAAVVAGAGITTMLSSLFGSSKGKPKAQTQSAVVKGSALAGNLNMMDGAINTLTSSSHHGGDSASQDALRGGLVVVQNIAIVAEKLPVIGSAAVLMLQLIDLCDAYRCNKTLFLALKARMQFMYSLYFAEGGIADIAHKKGKDSIIEPFARHLEILILDAIAYLTAFTTKGFFHKLMSGRRPQQRFAEIDQDITKCLNGLTAALQLMQVAEVTAAMEQLRLHTRQNEHLYEAVADVQRKVDRFGGLRGVRSMSREDFQKFSEELGVRDASELLEEVGECEQRFDSAVDKVSENVREVKVAVAGETPEFQELRGLVAELKSGTSVKEAAIDSGNDLLKWKLREKPVIDHKQLLGTGAFGSVYGGTYCGQAAAFKVPNTNASIFSPSSFPELQREVRLHLKVCACPGVVQILAVALQADEITSEPCIVMERAIGSLHDYLHKQKHRGMFLPVINLSLTSKLTLALQVASAMEYISAAGLIHRDIKSSNVLIFYQESGTTHGADADICAKICDFGLSRSASLESSIDTSSHITVKGTPSYLAPEAFNVQYSCASDVYAYGILLNELLTEQMPVPSSTATHTAPTIFQLRDAVCRDGKRPSLYAEIGSVGQALRKLISRCWRQEAADRCTFAEVTVELSAVLRTALHIAKYGSADVVVTNLSPISEETTDIGESGVGESSAEAVESIVVADPTESATTTLATEESVDTAPTQQASAAVPSRQLEELSVEQVGALMEAIHMHALRDVLVAHKVSGIMLACCESADDLLCPEYGLQSRGLAGGLLRKIQEWKVHGVPEL